MFGISPVITYGLVTAVVAAMVAAAVWGVICWLRRREWEEAWALIDETPETALPRLKRFARPGRWGVPKHASRARSLFGQALCLFRMGSIDEGEQLLATALTLSRTSAGDFVRLCQAYLVVEASRRPSGAITAWGQLLGQPAVAGTGEIRKQVEAALRHHLTPSLIDSPERLEQIVAWSRDVIGHAPQLAWVYHALGTALMILQRWQEALEPLQKYRELMPEDVEVLQLLGRAHRELGHWDEAQSLLTAAYQRAPTPESAHEAALACLAGAEHWDDADPRRSTSLETARRLWTWATENQAGFGAAWEGLGQARWQLGNRTESIAAVRQALAINPQSAVAHGLLAEYLWALGERDAARAELQQALQLDPKAGRVVRLAGDISYEDGDFPQAFSRYRELQSLGPIEDPVAERLARCCLETDQPQAAVDLLASRPSLAPAPRLVLGRSLARLGRWTDARDVLGIADAAGRTPEYDSSLATALAASGEHGEAERRFRNLQSDKDWSGRACRQLGHVKVLQRDYAGAAELYSANGDHPSSAFDLGRVSLLSDDADSARTHFARALAVDAGDELARFGLELADLDLGDSAAMAARSPDSAFYSEALEVLADRAFRAGRYVDALHGYEQVTKRRGRVSTQMLARMAVSHLQLRRFRDALSPLLELHKRKPDQEAICFNLAICYYQAGRECFAKEQWEAARKQFAQAEKLLRPLSPEQADGVQGWQLEAGYREAVRLLSADAASGSHLRRARDLLDFGTQATSGQLRWSLGAGIVHALGGDFQTSVDCLARARTLAPQHPPTQLALALSCQAAGQGARARETLGELLSGLERAGTKGGKDRLAVAARFTLAMSWAKDRNWPEAADTLLPLLQHPLIAQSQRLTPTDVAQAAVAYYAAAGDKQRASELAAQYLHDTRGLGDVLIGMVQAEAGDYEGAAATLGRAYAEQRDPKIGKVLVGCILASASAAVRRGELDQAEQKVAQALRYDANDPDAKRFREALGFARNLSQLDLRKLDTAIAQCRGMVEAGDRGPQLVRSLGVLYHRYACQAESKGRSAEQPWQTCLKFWQQQILKSNGFWDGFLTAYNTGRGRRDQLKEEQVASWRAQLPSELASRHVRFAGDCLSRNDANGLARHLKLIWDWKPDYVPGDGFLLEHLPSGDLSDGVVNTLQNCLKDIKNPQVRQVISKVIEGQKMKKAIPWFNEGCAAMNRALEALNMQAALFKAMAESGMGYAARDAMQRAIREALNEMRQAKNLIKKAYDLVPSDPDFKKAYDWARTQVSEVEGALRNLS